MKTKLLCLFLALLAGAKAHGQESPRGWAERQAGQMDLGQMARQVVMAVVEQPEGWAGVEAFGGCLLAPGLPIEAAALNGAQARAALPLLVAADLPHGLPGHEYRFALLALHGPAFAQFGQQLAQGWKSQGIHLNTRPLEYAYGATRTELPLTGKPLDDHAQALELAKAYARAGVLAGFAAGPNPLAPAGALVVPFWNPAPEAVVTAQALRDLLARAPELAGASFRPDALAQSLADLQGDLRRIGLRQPSPDDFLRLGPESEQSAETLLRQHHMLLSRDPERLASRLAEAAAGSESLAELLRANCLRVLEAKWHAGLSRPPARALPPVPDGPEPRRQARELAKQYITALGGPDLPLADLSIPTACLSIGYASESPFQSQCRWQSGWDCLALGWGSSAQSLARAESRLRPYPRLVVALHPTGQQRMGSAERDFLRRLAAEHRLVLVVFGAPSLLDGLDFLPASGTLLAYSNDPVSQEVAADVLFGSEPCQGVLPIDAGPFRAGEGRALAGLGRLNRRDPEELGMDAGLLRHKIDSLARLGLEVGAYPGCQVLVAFRGSVVLHECWGSHTYDGARPTRPDDLYDLASLTKTLATTLALMRLHGQGLLPLDATLGRAMPEFAGSNKAGKTLRAILSHNAQLAPWIPFWTSATDGKGNFLPQFVSADSSATHSLRLSDSLYVSPAFRDECLRIIRESRLASGDGYRYSDLGFYLFPLLVERLSGRDFRSYLREEFYLPLGAGNLGYNPLSRFPKDRVVPTEQDDLFRRELLHGHVHDEGAAMLGGVSGHAGLFGDALGVARVLQMMLQGGSYAQRSYLGDSTLAEFTRRHFEDKDNRRGLGFDKPLIDNAQMDFAGSYPCPSASAASFGHTGFTGTLFWADPESELLFVFLSNRVHPTRDNSRLFDLNIRSGMLEYCYQSLPR